MKHVATKTTYLEMLAAPEGAADPPREDLSVSRKVRPTVEEYLYLYNSVGRDYQWIDRNLMAPDELEVILRNELIEVHELSVGDRSAGFAELDRRRDQQVELAYFGLFPEFIGQGIGKYFLQWVVERAWSYQPRRVWVHTCDLDHPAALPNYQRAGFQIYDEQIIQQVVKET